MIGYINTHASIYFGGFMANKFSEVFQFGRKVIGSPAGRRVVKYTAVGAAAVTGFIAGSATAVAKDETDPNNQSTGPLAPLSKSLFHYGEWRYPSDLGGDRTRYPYYMKFNINISEKSQYQSQFGIQTPEESSKFSQKASTTGLQGVVRRKTRRTNQAILIYMPDTMQWGFNHQWEGESLTQATGIKAGALGAGIVGAFKGLTGTTAQEREAGAEAFKSALVTGLSQTVGQSLGMSISEGLAQAAIGKAVNPNEELLYKGPGFREFQFEFMFAPRNASDAKTALDIIQAFKFHAAPELPGGDGGRYFIPPSDFDIEFYNNNDLLWQIGSIGRCVLQSITVDYGAAGQFAAFADGYPSHIRMQLQFKEIDIVTKRQIAESGF
jgi:hypothetical protein